jgi:hypothetical protein
VLRAIRAENSVGSAIASSKRVGVQRLRAAQHRAHRLVGGAHHVVVGVLFLQADAGGLAMGAQHLGAFGLFAPNSVMIRCQSVPRRAQLGDLHEEVHADGEEEDSRPAKLVHIHARAIAARTYSRPSASVKASSCTRFAPASCMW